MPRGKSALRTPFALERGATSAGEIRAEIVRLVADEDPAAPPSDLALTSSRSVSGRPVARAHAGQVSRASARNRPRANAAGGASDSRQAGSPPSFSQNSPL